MGSLTCAHYNVGACRTHEVGGGEGTCKQVCTRVDSEGKRQVKPKRFADFVATNIVERFETNNSRCFTPPEWKTDQARNSFFHRTVVDWNKLSETQVQAKTPEEFRLETSSPRA